jgi:cytochrome b561
MTEATIGWSLRARLFHWISTFAVTGQWVIGYFLLGGMAMVGSTWLVVHLSFGLTILGLTIFRLGSRLLDIVPSRPTSQLLAGASSVGHIGLYVLLMLVPLSGWLGYRPAPFMPAPLLYGVLPMPVLSGVSLVSSRTWMSIHAVSCWILVILIGLHVVAALIHRYILRDGIVRGMFSGTMPTS